MGVIHDHRWRAIPIEGDVTYDTDHLEPLSARGDALVENALVQVRPETPRRRSLR